MERSQGNSKTEKGVIMAGRTGIAKKGKLYGDWGMSDMEDQLEKGVDEAQAAGAAALAEKPKYRGRKSDLAFIEAQKKKKAAKKKKQSGSQRSDRDKFKTSEAYMTREIKKGPRNEKVASREPYKVVKGDSPEIESYGLPKKKAKKKRVGRTLY